MAQKISSLKFRTLQESDLDTLRRWRMLPEVTKYLLSDPVITPQAQKQWFKELQQNRNALYWIISFHKLDIGYTALTNIDQINKRADSSVYIAEAGYRDRGFGKSTIAALQKYAFTHLHLHKLWGHVLSENHPALHLYLKQGWKIEGILRDHIYKDKFHDVYMIALLKEDWLK